jgi:hypothetical protein
MADPIVVRLCHRDPEQPRLRFRIDPVGGGTSEVPISLRNDDANQIAAFRVKTTDRSRFDFVPAMGVVEPSGSITITATFKDTTGELIDEAGKCTAFHVVLSRFVSGTEADQLSPNTFATGTDGRCKLLVDLVSSTPPPPPPPPPQLQCAHADEATKQDDEEHEKDEAAAPTAAAEAATPSASQQPADTVRCLVCLDERGSREAMICCEGPEPHYMCDAPCLCGYLESQLDVHTGRIACPGCAGASNFSHKELARRLPDELFERYMVSLRQVDEKRYVREAEERARAMVERELQQAGASPGLAAQRARDEIAELLVVKCTCCGVALALQDDFEGCFALYCSNCPARPCAWCLRDVGPDNTHAHEHVARCSEAPEPERSHHHGALYCRNADGEEDLHKAPYVAQRWRRFHRQRVAPRVRAVVEAMEEEGLREEVLSGLADALEGMEL